MLHTLCLSLYTERALGENCHLSKSPGSPLMCGTKNKCHLTKSQQNL